MRPINPTTRPTQLNHLEWIRVRFPELMRVEIVAHTNRGLPTQIAVLDAREFWAIAELVEQKLGGPPRSPCQPTMQRQANLAPPQEAIQAKPVPQAPAPSETIEEPPAKVAAPATLASTRRRKSATTKRAPKKRRRKPVQQPTPTTTDDVPPEPVTGYR